MDLLELPQGRSSWICDNQLDIESSCYQRIAIDGLNILFALAFTITVLVRYLRRHHMSENRNRNRIFAIVSACCILTSIGYFASGFWVLIEKRNRRTLWNMVFDLIRGIVWMILAASLYFHRTRAERILSLSWWLSFSILISAFNIKALVLSEPLRINDMASWPVTFLLLFSSLRLITYLNQDASNHGLSEPLLAESGRKPEPRRPSFINRLTFAWINPLLRIGSSKPLCLQDIPPLEPEDEAHVAYEAFIREFDILRKKDSNSRTNLVLRALAKCYMKETMEVGFLALLRTLSVLAAPLLLYAFVNYAENEKEEDLKQALMLVGLLFLVKLVESLSQRHWYFGARRYGMRMRSALMAAVYQKLLKLSSSAKQRHSTGEIVNYIAVDAYRLGEFPWWFHTTWTLPLQLVISIAVLYFTVGSGTLPGLVPLLVCGFLNFPFAKVLQKCQGQAMAAQDERLRATSEVLNSMKIIKLQSWEEKFENVIVSLRENEFRWLSETQIKKSYGTVLYWMSPLLVSSMVFAGCSVLRSAPLNASTIFTVLATLRVMSEPVRTLPEAMSMLIQVKVSLDRLDVFLLESELKEEDVLRGKLQNSDWSVQINSGYYSWDPLAATHTLKDVNLEIKRGQKIAICGPVGSGKSSLLCALLGEIPKISGSVSVHGFIAYVAQTSWIQSGTIRDNILYGKPMDKIRYERSIKVCALDKDIDNFDHGDLTEIGQRGLNLSGGQKQRIQLARAVYNDADIYLLDDPFSAVDAHTAAILFNECVMEALETKTVILVTHQVEFLVEADKILVMEDGRVTQMGKYGDLLKAGTSFERLTTAHEEAMTALNLATNGDSHDYQKGSTHHMDTHGFLSGKEHSQEEISAKDLSTVQLTEEEQMETHGGWTPYIDYVAMSNGYLLLSSLLVNQSVFMIFQTASTYWLALAVQKSHIGSGILIGVYAGLSALSAIFVYLRSLSAALLGLKASKAFFLGFTRAVFKAPMLFFDSTPIGRILIRASSDMSVIDYDIPYSTAFALTGFLEVILTIIIMATVTWQVLVVAIPVLFVAIYIQEYYLASARALIRINGTTKAPVTNYASETSLGVVTIRAFEMVKASISNNLKLVDTDASLFFYTNAAMEWVLFRVETLQNLTILTSALFLVLIPKSSLRPGLMGLSLSYALSLTGTQIFLTRFYCSLANYIISAERIKQYMHIPPEPPAIIEDTRPPCSWPSQGRIDIQDLKVKYRPNAPLVLKGVTCTLRAGERVGVVGRTGSGKTTLISALFRLVEPESGKILIDGLDICTIGMKDLRMKLSIIPQEPALFRGSVRSNLDPLGLYSDTDIWEALRKCQLSTVVRSLPQLLDSSVSDEGQNWSVGQRQLFCLGRVLLKRNRILVLDEATASVDSATDAVLQSVIRQEFQGCTVVTVAHRVPTVTDSDMVMVLSYGKLIEYDKPSMLMGTNSSFAKLVAEYWANCRRNST